MNSMTKAGSPAWLGLVNERSVLSLALEQGVITRQMAHEQTGLSKPAISQVLARLVAIGVIQQIGPVDTQRGPKATGYAVNANLEVGVAIDVSSTEIKGRFTDVAGLEYPLVRFERHYESRGEAAADVAISDLQRIMGMATKAAGKPEGSVKHVFLSVPGSVAPDCDELDMASAMNPWPTRGLRTLIESELLVKADLAQDVRAAMVAEIAASENTEDMSLLWIGPGLALASSSDGEIIKGYHGRAGEIGYVPNGESVSTQLQDVLGGQAVAALVQALGFPVRTFDEALPFLPQAMNDRQFFETIAGNIATMAISILFILDPKCLVLGGPTSIAGGTRLADRTAEIVKGRTGWGLPVYRARVPRDAPLVGAQICLRKTLASALLDRIGRF